MSEKLSLRTNGNGDIYVYIEDSSGASLAFGADSANGVVALNTLSTTNVQPLESTANMTIDPTANGDILFRPHGTGKSEFNTGDVQVTVGDVNVDSGNINMPNTSADGTEGVITLGGTRFMHNQNDFNTYLGNEAGPIPGVINVAHTVGIGYQSINAPAVGTQFNTAVGSQSLLNPGGERNTAIGYRAGYSLAGTIFVSGQHNTLLGTFAGADLLTGSDNCLVGYLAGSDYVGAESNNICISNVGSAGDSNAIRIGTAGTHLTAYFAGVYGVTPGGAGEQLMAMDSSGQMGTTSGGTFFVSSLATDSGSATPAAGVITIAGGLNITTSGAASTVTVNVGEIVGVTNSGASTVPYIATGTGQLGTVPGGAVLMNTGTQSLSISSDASATTVAIATGAAVKGLTLGSTNSTSASTLQSGSGALNVTSTNGALTINSGTGALSISNDASATTVTIATGGAVKGTTLGSTNSTSATTVQSGSGALALTSTNGTWTGNSGTGALGISTDASATTVSFATGGAVKTVTLGSTNSTSATTVQSGSGALNVTSTNGAMTINSGTGTLAISSDASVTTVNVGTGAAAKTVTVGSTSGAGLLALKYGTADFSVASATGNVMVALDTGEITYPLQSSFYAYRSADVANVTGDGTTYTCTFNTEVTDRNSDYDNTTYTFTAPVTGLYVFILNIGAGALGVAHTLGLSQIVTTARTFSSNYSSWGLMKASNNIYMYTQTVLAPMTAGDTCTTNFGVYNSTKTVTFYGAAGNSSFFGQLLA